MGDCIFCKIISKQIPSKIVYEDDSVISFYDIDPQAPVHIVIVPKKHIKSLDHIIDEDQDLIGHIFLCAKKIAGELGLKDGYRIINNCGKLGGQTVDHIHFHLLGGRELQWPPG
ncbi:histidine triad nucleotide-binding protein [Inediibacterium massiliense]|uniref:histidine triad nucleotide-binding protein n=1 Tax=Inediibacterium massiliense TaxID=1658111 RepID=UPI0006B40DDD|nr:histidine triad nucleotide-binding protein [Inediibacterium massiliense]